MALRRISTRKRRTKVDHVGFSSLPEQVHRKSLKKGFEFTLLVVGESGLGKSTLVNSLFMTDLYGDRVQDNVNDRIKKTVEITTQTAELEEKGVRLKLTAVDTPGFGESINAEDCWRPIAEYIDQQFNLYYTHESGYGIERKKVQDTRVHCCLYFIPSYVRGLRPIDIETMKSLQKRVNIIPIISKADSLTKKELEYLKQNILSDIEKYEIKIYEFPICDDSDDDQFKKIDEDIRNSIPFAVIGSNTIIESGNKRVRGRVYPWGIIDIESECCDFVKLRTFLCSSHMHDLKDLTHDFHYENYRTEYIKGQKHGSLVSNSNKQRIHPVDDADRLLQQKDAELRKMQDLIAKMKYNMNCNNNNVSSNNSCNHNNNTTNTNSNTNSMPPNNIVLSSFGSGNKNSAIKNLNIQGNHLISRHINNSYSNNNYQTDKPNNYAQNLNTFQSLTNSTPI